MKSTPLLIALLFNIAAFSQNTINGYKYVIVPERFEFSKEDNQYRLNTTTRTLLEKKGFVAFVANEPLPANISGSRCNALKAEVVQRKAFFTTNLTLILKDCQGNVVFKGKEGKSREKEFQLAYDEALMDAFSSLNSLDYHYDSSLLAQSQQAAPAVASPAPVAASPASVVSSTASTTGGAAPASVPVPGNSIPVDISGTLYAQATANGYQLVDTSPKKVMTLLKTSAQDFYIAEGANGVVFKKENDWLFERYENGKLVSQKLQIKF